MTPSSSPSRAMCMQCSMQGDDDEEEDEEDWMQEDDEDDEIVSNATDLDRQGHGSRVIIHCDMDAFYYQCEELKDPSLKDRPVGVSQKYLIVTANYVARARGVTKLQSISEALKRCPELKIINGEDLTPFREVSERIFDLFQGYTPLAKRLGYDETFLDVTLVVERMMREEEEAGRREELPTPVGHVYHPAGSRAIRYCTCGCVRRLFYGSILASEMRRELKDKIGLRCCAGVATNMMLAKLAGEMHKPDQQTTLLPQFAADYIAGLPARKLPGCGWSINGQLQAIGIETVADMRTVALPHLVGQVGEKTAKLLTALCWGVDHRVIKPQTAGASSYKTISEEDSFRQCRTREEVGTRMSGLLAALLPRIAERRAKSNELPHTLRLSLRNKAAGDGPRSRESRQCNIQNPESFFSGQASRIESTLSDLFDRMVPRGHRFELSLLNVGVTNFLPVPGASRGAARQVGGEEQQHLAGASPNILRYVRTSSAPAVATEAKEGEVEEDVDACKACEGGGRKRRRRMSSVDVNAGVPLPVLTNCDQCGVRVRACDVAWHERWHAEGAWHCDAPEDDEEQRLDGGGKVTDTRSGGDGEPRPGDGGGDGGDGDDGATMRRLEALGVDAMVFRFLPSDLQQEILGAGIVSYI